MRACTHKIDSIPLGEITDMKYVYLGKRCAERWSRSACCRALCRANRLQTVKWFHHATDYSRNVLTTHDHMISLCSRVSVDLNIFNHVTRLRRAVSFTIRLFSVRDWTPSIYSIRDWDSPTVHPVPMVKRKVCASAGNRSPLIERAESHFIECDVQKTLQDLKLHILNNEEHWMYRNE